MKHRNRAARRRVRMLCQLLLWNWRNSCTIQSHWLIALSLIAAAFILLFTTCPRARAHDATWRLAPLALYP